MSFVKNVLDTSKTESSRFAPSAEKAEPLHSQPLFLLESAGKNKFIFFLFSFRFFPHSPDLLLNTPYPLLPFLFFKCKIPKFRSYSRLHNRPLRFPFYKSSLILNFETVSASKKGNSDGSTGSKSITEKMKSYKILKSEAELKLNNQKKENVQDTKSKSFKN